MPWRSSSLDDGPHLSSAESWAADLAAEACLLHEDGRLECLLASAAVEKQAALPAAATSALAVVLSQPWSYDFTRLLLCADAAELLRLSIFHGSGGHGEKQQQQQQQQQQAKPCWTVAEARSFYEPALLRTVGLLLRARADPNGESGSPVIPQSPLMCCALAGWPLVASLLLGAAAEVGRADRSGATALHYAATHSEVRVAELLISAGADLDQPDAHGRSAAALAELHGLSLTQHDLLAGTRRSGRGSCSSSDCDTSRSHFDDVKSHKEPHLVRNDSIDDDSDDHAENTTCTVDGQQHHVPSSKHTTNSSNSNNNNSNSNNSNNNSNSNSNSNSNNHNNSNNNINAPTSDSNAAANDLPPAAKRVRRDNNNNNDNNNNKSNNNKNNNNNNNNNDNTAKRVRRAPGASEGVVQGTTLGPDAFVSDYIATKRPVLLKGAASHLLGPAGSASCWGREGLAERAGRAQGLVSIIPYASDFGVGCDSSSSSSSGAQEAAEEPMTLADFLTRQEDTDSPRSAAFASGIHAVRRYFFVPVDEQLQPDLADLFKAELGLPGPGCLLSMPPFVSTAATTNKQPNNNNDNNNTSTASASSSSSSSSWQFWATTLQFGVGDEGSGSPLHFHQDAINILLSGRKRWWLVPPARAAMSRVHPLDALQNASSPEGELYTQAMVLEQEPGDIMYVPDMWGHAVLNLAKGTVCATAEFA
ncbi:unnamed protein product [Polarella glacialis]|uniref:JmjC domain-containing protein n=1 Tax=Polarella glacialis TaxID=89957 RepID=A0A813F962_POLGL|nr:unnamed protein product [Polarella glacialis]